MEGQVALRYTANIAVVELHVIEGFSTALTSNYLHVLYCL